jgi:hypothetical protein
MLDFLWTIWLGAWCLFKMGSFLVIIGTLFVLTILFWIGTECKDAKRQQKNIRYHGKP